MATLGCRAVRCDGEAQNGRRKTPNDLGSVGDPCRGRHRSALTRPPASTRHGSQCHSGRPAPRFASSEFLGGAACRSPRGNVASSPRDLPGEIGFACRLPSLQHAGWWVGRAPFGTPTARGALPREAEWAGRREYVSISWNGSMWTLQSFHLGFRKANSCAKLVTRVRLVLDNRTECHGAGRLRSRLRFRSTHQALLKSMLSRGVCLGHWPWPTFAKHAAPP